MAAGMNLEPAVDTVKRILFVNHVACISGAERGLLDIVGGLDPCKYEALAALPRHGPLAHELRARGIRTLRLPMMRFRRTRNPLRLAGCAMQLLASSLLLAHLIRRERVSLVHCNSSIAQLYGGLACRLTGTPCIWHCRDLVELGAAGRLMGRTATRVIAISACVREHVAPYVARAAERLVTLPNAIDTEHFRPQGRRQNARRELGVAEDAFVVLHAGQLVPWKNHELFIETAALTAARLPTARFIIAGADLFGEHGEARLALQRDVARLGLQGRLEFIGYRDDMAALLEGADLFMHTAAREPFGRAVAEAMAMGLPVVAINACGPAELIRDGVDGLLAPPQDAAALAEAALRVAADRAFAQRLGASARRRMGESFNQQAYRVKLEKLYDAVCQPGGSATTGQGDA